jgi:glycine/D-amino acid oxidase-like deaminating enzyme
MRIAIIGAGFSGLSVAWHLLSQIPCELTLFDAKGVGAGASGIAAGLLHPYVGEEGKRSFLAAEGLEAAKQLITIAEEALGVKVANREGILRHTLNEEQNTIFSSHCEKFKDVKKQATDTFLIESGITVDCPQYLKGLFQAISAKGGKLQVQKITDPQSLEGFDHIIIATGAGIAQFEDLKHLRYSLTKGQVLLCKAPDTVSLPTKSSICKGYMALSPEKGICHLGSTYERGEVDDTPNLTLAKNTLFPKIALMFPDVDKLEILGCNAALRVIRKGHYFPIAAKVKEGVWVLTALGSRGLLYHALLGKILAEAIATGDVAALDFLALPPS